MTSHKFPGAFIKKTGRSAALGACVVLLPVLAGAMPAGAQDRISRGIVQPAASEHAAVYNGSAPYICSPSGFGHLSTCTLRSSKVFGG